MKANNERRNNPEIRAEVKRVLDARVEAHVKALALVKEAYEIMRATPYQGIDADIYDRGTSAVWSAYYTLGRDERFVGRNTETYIGNVAAFELGEVIEKNMEKENK